MKKRIKICLLLIIAIFVCTACDGNVTRALRHEGFNIGEDFVCDAFFGKEATQHIRFITDNRIITTEGRIYEMSLGQTYYNKSNCKKAETELKVVAMFEDKVFKADDGNYYYLVAQNNVDAYIQIPATDNAYTIYDLLLKPEGTIKAMTADSSAGIYYVLKSDGNVYSIKISKSSSNAPATITESNVVYSQTNYGGTIIDFAFHGDSPSTFVRTNSKVYRMKAVNVDECSKYADITCNYEMMESTVFEEYADSIAAYNGSMVLTSYRKVFTVSG